LLALRSRSKLKYRRQSIRLDWLLPGSALTGKRVEMPFVLQFKGDKLVHEHFYRDQASALVLVEVLAPRLRRDRGASARSHATHERGHPPRDV
jgi:hypothetical protein